jgi:DNA replication and repair protein RecF
VLELEINPGKANRARVNRSALPRAREILGLLRTVLFAPEDLALVKGDPGERRRFLDELLVAQSPRLAGVRQDYDRVLKQRNALLKTAGATVRAGRGDLRTLDVWDAHLARAGADLLAARLRLVSALTPLVEKCYDAVSPEGGPTGLDYRCSLGPDVDLVPDRDVLAAALLAALSAARPTELDRGVSLVGPHRDDLVLRLGPLPARGYASQGESWSYALALRLAAFELLRGEGTDPVLLLDDVFAELDDDRRQRLATRLIGPEDRQVFLTAPRAEELPRGLRLEVWSVTDGRVRGAAG